jgi:hypothetical protein
MPVYNGERFLRAALDSVLAQTFRDFEFIVVDDGSSDATPRVLGECRDSRLAVHRIEHTGLIGALNAGFARCRGEFIARMDADDLCRPERLARQIQLLQSRTDIDVVTCWSDLIDDAGQNVGRRTGGVADDMLLELASGNQIVHGSVMLRRAALPPEPVFTAPPEDYRLWVRLARDGRRFHAIEQPLYAFRTHAARYSLTHAATQSRGIVDVQWPVLEECSASRDANDLHVRARLVRGWGSVAGAAYCAGDRERGDTARRRFIDLLRGSWTDDIDSAARHGIESMIWGGCPWPQALALRFREWRRRPTSWTAYRNLLLALPPVQFLRYFVRRTP